MASYQKSTVRCPIFLLLVAFSALALLIPTPAYGQTFQSVGMAWADSNGKEFGKATFLDSDANKVPPGSLTNPEDTGAFIATLTLDGTVLFLTVPFGYGGSFVGGTPDVPGVYFESSDCSGTPLFDVTEAEAAFGLQVVAVGQPGNTVYVPDPAGTGQTVFASSISAPWGCFPQSSPLEILAVTATPLIDLTTVFSFPLSLVADIPTTGGSSTALRFAQFGNGGGFTSDLVLTNPSASAAVSGQVDFFDNDGLPLSIGIAGSEGAAPLAAEASPSDASAAGALLQIWS